jgi:hypothetical protein
LEDVHGLKNILMNAVSNQAALKRMGLLGFNKLQQNFSVSQMLDQTLELYAKLSP